VLSWARPPSLSSKNGRRRACFRGLV
jgi:hypothetical protein